MSKKIPNQETLKLWEKLVELKMFHDGTNQERLRNFMIIEATIMLGFVIVLAQLFTSSLILSQFVFLVLGTGLCVMGFLLARRTSSLDKRTYRHMQHLNHKLHGLETQFSPNVIQAIAAPAVPKRFKTAPAHKPAHRHTSLLLSALRRGLRRGKAHFLRISKPDRLLLSATALAWALAFICMVGVMLVMLTPDWNIAMIKLSNHVMNKPAL